MGKYFAAVTLLLAVLSPVTAVAIEGDENWSASFALPGADAEVNSTLVFNSDLIIGGDFLHVGQYAANRIALWDGSSWSAMGAGFDAPVHALAVHGGELYAAGEFDHSGTVPLSRVARWDGVSWQPLEGQIGYHAVLTLHEYDGALIAGGIADWRIEYDHYSEMAGLSAWDGAHWTEMATFPWGQHGRINDLEVISGDLIAAGYFGGIDGDWSIYGAARWDGSAWFSMGSTEYLNELLIHDSGLYGASYTLRQWDGLNWAPVAGSPSGPIEGLASYSGGIAVCGDLEVDGIFGVAFWDGSIWSPIGDSFANPGATMDTPPHTLNVYAGLLVAGGWFRQVGQAAIPNLAAWDGATWSPLIDVSVPSQFHGLDYRPSALGSFEGHLAVGGKFDFSDNSALHGLGLWDGSAWESPGPNLPGLWDCIYAVEEYQGVLVVGGQFDEIGGIPSPHLAKWTGSEWMAFDESAPNSCTDLQADGTDLYASGSYYVSGMDPYIKRWDGSAWHDLDGGLNGWIEDLAIFDGDLVAVGEFTADSTGQSLGHIARWDGSAWVALGSGFDDQAFSLCGWNGGLVAGGVFTVAGGNSASYLAFWDGIDWQAIPGQLNDVVTAVIVFNGDLIVGGRFTEVAGVEVNGIARWDGVSWSALGSGLGNRQYYDTSSFVTDMVVVDNSLYVCGPFVNAGGLASFGIACWTEDLTAVPDLLNPGESFPAANWPNPFNPSTEIQFTLPADAFVTVRLFDSAGRRVRSLLDHGPRTAGDIRLTWDGRDDSGQPLPSGVYFCEVEAGEYRATRKMTLLK